MDELLARKILRNIRILNAFLILFSLIVITAFVITGIIAYKVYNEVRDARNSLTSLQTRAQTDLNVKGQLCDSSSGSLKALLKSQSDICD